MSLPHTPIAHAGPPGADGPPAADARSRPLSPALAASSSSAPLREDDEGAEYATGTERADPIFRHLADLVFRQEPSADLHGTSSVLNAMKQRAGVFFFFVFFFFFFFFFS
jgi:hypothetical protein